jgi:O-antigen/teichoic acid export membrane protein
MQSLRAQAASGVKWTALSSGGLFVCSFAQLAVLGRWLTPSDFGLMAMVTVIIGFAYVFADAGMSNAVVFRQHSSAHVLSTLYWTNIGTGVALTAGLWLAAPLVASFYRSADVAGLLRLAGFVLLIVAAGQLPQALLQRDLAFKGIALIEIVAGVAGLSVAIATAAMGQGARSFVWGQLTTASIRSLALLLLTWSKWRPRLHFARSDLRGYVGFGAYQLGERSVNYWAANLDYLLVGRFLGSTALGPYTVAYQLAAVPMQRLNPVLTRVAFPVLARAQADDARLMRGYLELVKAVAFLSFPLLAGLAICASVAVPTLVGSQWVEAVPIVQVLCIMGAMKVLANTSGSLLLAKGRADIGFWWNLFTMSVTALCLLMVVSQGVLQVAIVQAALSVLFLAIMLGVLRRVVGLPALSFVAAAFRPGLATAAMAAVLIFALAIAHWADLTPIVTLLCCAGVGVAAYVLAWRFLEKGYVSGTWSLLLGSRRRAA